MALKDKVYQIPILIGYILFTSTSEQSFHIISAIINELCKIWDLTTGLYQNILLKEVVSTNFKQERKKYITTYYYLLLPLNTLNFKNSLTAPISPPVENFISPLY